MMNCFRILDYKMMLSGCEDTDLLQFLENFKAEDDERRAVDLHFQIRERSDRAHSYGIEFHDPELLSSVHRTFFSRMYHNGMLCAETQEYERFYLEKEDGFTQESLMELLMPGFYSFASLHETMLLHASAVEYRGQAVVFTAPSGTGKTTQAHLWQKFLHADILNGDKVFVKREKDSMFAWGSPWKGSSPYAVNRCAPLKALIVLRQAEWNRIRRLDILEAMELFVPHVFFPRWDARCEKAVFDLLDHVLENIQVYLLECRPDEEAVLTASKEIFG